MNEIKQKIYHYLWKYHIEDVNKEFARKYNDQHSLILKLGASPTNSVQFRKDTRLYGAYNKSWYAYYQPELARPLYNTNMIRGQGAYANPYWMIPQYRRQDFEYPNSL